MNLDDIMTAGSLIVNVALGFVVCRNTLSNQENSDRIKIFEIMQSRGMLPTTQELDQVLIEEQRKANQEIEAAARQKSLPAPRPKKNVTKDARGYDPSNESYVDETQPILQTRRRVPQSSVRTVRTSDYNGRTARVPYGQRRQYGDVYDE